MASPPNIIRVPKAAGEYNPNRPLSKNTLLLSQVKHFFQAEQNLAAEDRTGISPEAILTEGQAAEYIRKVTAKLHIQTGKAGGS
jgi:hypothetical protein